MRRIAPWLPIAIALATLTVGALQAVAQGAPDAAGRFPVFFLPHMIVLFGSVPYVIPMLLLAWAKSVRCRSGAPPWVGRTAVALALPALVVAVVWPLGTGIALLVHYARVAHALLVDYRLACIAAWAVSVAGSAIWVAVSAGHRNWWARPVAVGGMPPYR
jgi:hypothetical protein